MAIALPILKKPLDRALTIVTGSPEWRSAERLMTNAASILLGGTR
jgi:hypothetical protein